MKNKVALFPLVGLTTWVVVAALGQPKVGTSAKEFMREKLAHSQIVLEALALEDFFTLEQRSKS